MKKRLLISAVATALTAVGTAHAVNVNPDGLGQVLLYPYFTVQNEFATAVHVVNTTTQAKAVKVRFLEGKNSQEVLDFNLYLSPEDVWTGVVVRDEANGARVISTDTSCIAPRQLGLAGVAFRTFEFADEVNNDEDDLGAVDRRREGYVELIEMGVLDDPLQVAAVTHTAAGEPLDCSVIVAADFASLVSVVPPTGGLFGTGHLISVNGGVRTSFNATALENFVDGVNLWSISGSTSPSLADVNTAADIIDGNTIVAFDNLIRPIDNVSAVLTHDAIYNEYVIDAGRESKTDWVVTFPTKRFYVNTLNPSPFQNVWDEEDLSSCHNVSFRYFDREEQGQTPGEGDFSPAPIIPGFALCNEVNTLTLYPSTSDVEDGRLFGAKSTAAALAIDNYEAGWMEIVFGTGLTYGTITDGANVITGLATIGFGASSSINKVDVEVDGLTVFSSYMSSTAHKGTRNIVD